MSALSRFRRRGRGGESSPPPEPGRLSATGPGPGALTRRLVDGIPRGAVALLAILVLAAVLYTVSSHEATQSRGWAEFTMFPRSCAVDPKQRLNVTGCVIAGRRAYKITFTRSLSGATVLVSRGVCCPGEIRASVVDDRTVLIAIPKAPRPPVRGTVFVP